MDDAAIRRANLQNALDERYGGVIADLARAIERDDAYVWQLLRGTRNIGERVARHIETALHLARGTLDHPRSLGDSATPEYNARRVPVLGTAQLGEDGFHYALDYPVGHGDGFIDYPTADKNAYALRVKGDSMRPRIKHGEFVLIEPDTAPQAGEEVLVRTTDGRVMVKVLDFRRDGVVQLSSVNEAHRPITLDEKDIERLHYVAAIVKPSRYYKTLT